MAYNTVTGLWAMLFDGSDVGATPNLDAIHVESDGTLLISFDAVATLTGLGTVEDEDIVRFLPTTMGDTTAGTFAWVLDGSDVGLDTADEDIDAIARAPDGRLVVSSDGAFNPGGVSGVGQDLFVFTDTSLGETTSGSWAVYFDGSDVGLTASTENIWGVEIIANGAIYLTTISTYAVTGVSGDSDDFFTCTPGTLGDTTSCTYSLYWDGDGYGVGSEWLDALAISDVALVGAAGQVEPPIAPVFGQAGNSTAENATPAQAANHVYLPVIQQE